MMGPVGPGCINGGGILSSWQNPHICSLICEVGIIMVRKARGKLVEMFLPKKKESKNNTALKELQRLVPTLKTWKR